MLSADGIFSPLESSLLIVVANMSRTTTSPIWEFCTYTALVSTIERKKDKINNSEANTKNKSICFSRTTLSHIRLFTALTTQKLGMPRLKQESNQTHSCILRWEYQYLILWFFSVYFHGGNHKTKEEMGQTHPCIWLSGSKIPASNSYLKKL